MENTHPIKKGVQDWIVENKKNLPIRFNTAKVSLTPICNTENDEDNILGKYNSKLAIRYFFYRPISKIINIPEPNEQ